jgi:uncharacterized membrane protein
MNTVTRFLKKEAISFGWRTVTGNLWFFVCVGLIVVVSGSMSQVLRKTGLSSAAFFPIIGLAFWALQIFVQLGATKVALKSCDGINATISDLFSQGRLFLRYLGASILYGLIVAGGFILLIVPGIVWAIKFSYFSYAIVDKDLGIIASLKESARITSGSKWNLFLFGLLLVLINFIGAIALGVGLLVTIPLSMVASAFAYRKLAAEVPAPTVSV